MSDQKRRSASRARSYAMVLLAGLLFAGCSNSSEAAPEQTKRGAVRTASGDLGRFVGDLAKGMSRDAYFQKPSEGEAARLGEAFGAVRAGKLERAAALARPLGYKVVRYVDRNTRRKLVLLVEGRLRPRGWGLYAHSPKSRSRLVVEVAHPRADIKSEKVGVETFRRADAAGLLVAGAHRYAAADGSADAAHSSTIPFQAVHGATLTQRVIVLQPHGFEADVRGAEFGEIVVSSGGAPTRLVTSLANRLRADGRETCLYSPGHCEGLGGTTNVQGRSAREAGASFVHLELALPLRATAVNRKRIASILARTLR